MKMNTDREWLLKRAEQEDGCDVGVGGMSWDEIMALFVGVKITFSRNCSSGILPPGEQCECWRCRRERGEPLDSEIEQMAETQSAARRKTFVLPLALLLCALALSAAPITATPGDPCATQICQSWYTVDVPRDGGVYPLEVYAPSLPRLWPGPPILELGEPPRLEPPNMQTPEPGTAGITITAIAVMILFCLLQYALSRWKYWSERWLAARLALHQILKQGDDRKILHRLWVCVMCFVWEVFLLLTLGKLFPPGPCLSRWAIVFGDWRPMDSAPRDGTVVELIQTYGVEPWSAVHKWVKGQWVRVGDEDRGMVENGCARWRPIGDSCYVCVPGTQTECLPERDCTYEIVEAEKREK